MSVWNGIGRDGYLKSTVNRRPPPAPSQTKYSFKLHFPDMLESGKCSVLEWYDELLECLVDSYLVPVPIAGGRYPVELVEVHASLYRESDNLIMLYLRGFENRLFLLGLDKYGKGDWRSISRNFVVTRTPTQVASHAQKYFIRLNSMNRDRRRSSIHDITSVNTGEVPVPPGPITGQANGSSAGSSSSKPNKQQTPVRATPLGASIYGETSIGQPIGGPFVSAVGTSVNLPPPAHMEYGVLPPIPGAVVPGAPKNVGPLTYPMPHTSMHR
ncbi:putative 6-phosphogluconate dehydrogenase isoform X1 [Capsicum annuum]|nr:putative 6-phosphogluconate dehydrogenase isoform X1 [Capsicum annuum]